MIDNWFTQDENDLRKALFFSQFNWQILVLLDLFIVNFLWFMIRNSYTFPFLFPVANGNASASVLRETTADGLRKRMQVQIADSIVSGFN